MVTPQGLLIALALGAWACGLLLQLAKDEGLVVIKPMMPWQYEQVRQMRRSRWQRFLAWLRAMFR